MSQSSNIKFTYFSGNFRLETNEMLPEDLVQAISQDENAERESYRLNENNELADISELSELEQTAYRQYQEFVITTRAFLREKKRKLG